MDNTSVAVDITRRKNILMLATLVATATYAMGLAPPGGVWQDTVGHLRGDPVMMSIDQRRYRAFFYLNATAFAFSLMVVVVSLVLTAYPRKNVSRFDLPLHLLMLAATLAFLVAYGTGVCRDKFRTIVFSLFVSSTSVSALCDVPFNWILQGRIDSSNDAVQKHRCKLIASLSMFMLTISYAAGLSTPGGFWDSAGASHRPGDAILHGKLLRLFSYFNIAQFVSSLYNVFMVMYGGQLHVGIVFSMFSGVPGLIVAYIVGSTRGRHTTIGVICGLCAAVVVYVVLYGAAMKATQETRLWKKLQDFLRPDSEAEQDKMKDANGVDENSERQLFRASSLVQLLAGLAVSITYQAGLYPPGGVWQDGHKAGDPILQTTNPARYKAFFFCNSVAFVASLLAIFLSQKSYLIEHHALQAVMILDLLGLIVAYAIGSCRDQISSMYAVCVAGAAVVYVVVHVQYFTLGRADDDKINTKRDDEVVDKKGRRFLLFAILVASITYQAGLTPPGGFLLQDDIQSGHHAGDPILLYNYPRRYKAFFYCNSVSFMLSAVQALLLMNPNLYRLAIRSRALALCSAVSFVCLIGAFGAGSTQHLKTSIYILVLGAVAFILCLPLLICIYFVEEQKGPEQKPAESSVDSSPPAPTPTPTPTPTEQQRPAGSSVDGNPMTMEQQSPNTESSDNNHTPSPTTPKEKDRRMRKRIYLMTLATLLGGVTYQAGLDPPGGSWQNTSDGHVAGNPVMQDNRRPRYLSFLYSNSTVFVASIYLIELLLSSMLPGKDPEMVIDAVVSLQYLGFLVAYAAGSSRQLKMSAHVGTLVVVVLAYVAVHARLSHWRRKRNENSAKH